MFTIYPTIKEWLDAKGYSQVWLAAALNMSRPHISEVVAANQCSATLALRIERLARREIDAATLNSEVADARRRAA